MEEKDLILVTNRTRSGTGYVIPERGIRKEFAPGEKKKISLDELYALSNVPGGEYILRHFLLIEDKDALDYLNMEVEPEYFYTEKEIRQIVENGTLDEFDDMLTFGAKSEGVIELAQKIAIETKLPDMRKRKMFLEHTGFSIDNALRVEEILKDDDEVEEAPKAKTRKAAPVKKETSARKAAPVTKKA